MGETGCGKTRLVKFMCALQVPPGANATNMVLMKVIVYILSYYPSNFLILDGADATIMVLMKILVCPYDVIVMGQTGCGEK